MSEPTLYAEPGKIVCADCRNPVIPAVPLEPSDLAPGDALTCDACGARMVSDEEGDDDAAATD